MLEHIVLKLVYLYVSCDIYCGKHNKLSGYSYVSCDLPYMENVYYTCTITRQRKHQSDLHDGRTIRPTPVALYGPAWCHRTKPAQRPGPLIFSFPFKRDVQIDQIAEQGVKLYMAN